MKESGKTYLLTIYRLSNTQAAVHSVDVARALDFSKPSVSRAMGLLKDAGLIEIAKGGAITLTKAGAKIAKDLEERVAVLTEFLSEYIREQRTKRQLPSRLRRGITVILSAY